MFIAQSIHIRVKFVKKWKLMKYYIKKAFWKLVWFLIYINFAFKKFAWNLLSLIFFFIYMFWNISLHPSFSFSNLKAFEKTNFSLTCFELMIFYVLHLVHWVLRFCPKKKLFYRFIFSLGDLVQFWCLILG